MQSLKRKTWHLIPHHQNEKSWDFTWKFSGSFLAWFHSFPEKLRTQPMSIIHNPFFRVLGFHVGLVADQPFYQTASVMCSDQAHRFIFLFYVIFAFNFLDNYKCYSLWELMTFPSMSGTVVVFLTCFIWYKKLIIIQKRGQGIHKAFREKTHQRKWGKSFQKHF